MKRKTKHNIAKAVQVFLYCVALFLLFWITSSWADIMKHSITDEQYKWWNIIVWFKEVFL